jgi:hypothetical protein
VQIGPDPTIEQLRDVLGALRCVYAAAPEGEARKVIREAAAEVASAIGVAESRLREKELVVRLRGARRALERAAAAVPWASPVLLGAVRRLPRVRG